MNRRQAPAAAPWARRAGGLGKLRGDPPPSDLREVGSARRRV